VISGRVVEVTPTSGAGGWGGNWRIHRECQVRAQALIPLPNIPPDSGDGTAEVTIAGAVLTITGNWGYGGGWRSVSCQVQGRNLNCGMNRQLPYDGGTETEDMRCVGDPKMLNCESEMLVSAPAATHQFLCHVRMDR
jgi:hypothetical protein